MKKTLVMGASPRPGKYSYIAVKRLLGAGVPVAALGRRPGLVCGVHIEDKPVHFEDIHTVTLYLNAGNQRPYYDYIISLEPERVIFNPGAENPELYALLREEGIFFEEACTLVMLSVGTY